MQKKTVTFLLREVIMSAKKMVLCVVFALLLPAVAWAEELGLDDINFALNSNMVVDDVVQLQRIAELLRSNPDLFIEIGGHTDKTGAQEYNQGLSVERASAVKKTLTDQGVAPERISIAGYGEDQPKVDMETREGYFQNRRVVFSIYRMDHGKKDYFYKDNVLVKPLVCVQPPRQKDLRTVAPAAPQEKAAEGAGVLSLGDNRVGMSVGLGSDDGDFTGTLEGRLFFPLLDRLAFQGGLLGNLNDTVKECEVDAGLVGKLERFQLGAFGSLKFADLDDYDEAASLSQLGLVASYLFDNASVGAFITAGIDSDDTIASEQRYVASDLIITDTYLKVRDKYGLNFDYAFENGLLANGEVGIVQADDHEAMGSLKLAYPLVAGMNGFVQGSYNTGYMEDDSNYAVVAGIEVGSWYRKKAAVEDIRPMQVPQVSYELKTRTYISKEASNKPPRNVSFSASPVSGSPFAVFFAGTATDPDGYIAAYNWDFGDGATGSGQTVTHTYSVPGIFNVRLTVVDNNGATASLTKEVKAPTW
jgi:hypothetical protein